MNQELDLGQLGTQDLLGILDRLRHQAEELLRSVREVGANTSDAVDALNQQNENNKKSPISSEFRMQYTTELPLTKSEFVKSSVFLNNGYPKNLESYGPSGVAYFDCCTKQIFLLETTTKIESLLIDLKQEKIISNYCKFRVINSDNKSKEISAKVGIDVVVLYKIEVKDNNNNTNSNMNNSNNGSFAAINLMTNQNNSDTTMQEETNNYGISQQSDASQQVPCLQYVWSLFKTNVQTSEIIQQQQLLVQHEKRRLTFGRLYFNCAKILRQGSCIFYCSTASGNQSFQYGEFHQGEMTIQTRQSLQGQLVDCIEFTDPRKVGLLVNEHKDGQFKLIIMENEQSEKNVRFTQLQSNLLASRFISLIEDRYLCVQVLHIKQGASNIVLDIQNRQLIAVLPGDNVLAVEQNDHGLRLIQLRDDCSIEDQTLKIVSFTKPSIALMNFLKQEQILEQYGQLTCKEIVDFVCHQDQQQEPNEQDQEHRQDQMHEGN